MKLSQSNMGLNYPLDYVKTYVQKRLLICSRIIELKYQSALGIITLGIMALSIMALGIMALGIITLGIMALSIMALGIMALGIMALGIMALGIMALGILALGKMSCNPNANVIITCEGGWVRSAPGVYCVALFCLDYGRRVILLSGWPPTNFCSASRLKFTIVMTFLKYCWLPVHYFQSNSVLNQNDSQKHISTHSDSVHVTFSSEILWFRLWFRLWNWRL